MAKAERSRALASRRLDRMESLRRASECAVLGALWFVFAVPLVTAGAAWCAAAEICNEWAAGKEPPLFRTFAAATRRNLGRGVLLATVLAVAAAVPYFEERVAAVSRIPGAGAERVGLSVVSMCCIALVLLAVGGQASGSRPWYGMLAEVAGRAWSRPWVVPTAVLAVGAGVVLIYAIPPLLVFMAGPMGYALSALSQRLLQR